MFDEHILYVQASSFDERHLKQYGSESLRRRVLDEAKKPGNEAKTDYVVHKTTSGGNLMSAPRLLQGKISDLG